MKKRNKILWIIIFFIFLSGSESFGNKNCIKDKIEKGKLTIGNCSQNIKEEQYVQSNLKLIEFHSSSRIKKIGRNAFVKSQLLYVILPNSVTSIGEGAFADNSNLKEIILPRALFDTMVMEDDFPFPNASFLLYCDLIGNKLKGAGTCLVDR